MGFVSGSAPADVDGMRSTWRIGGGEVRELVEGLVKRIWKEFKGVALPGWFRVMPYDVAMDVVGGPMGRDDCGSRSDCGHSTAPTSPTRGSACTCVPRTAKALHELATNEAPDRPSPSPTTLPCRTKTSTGSFGTRTRTRSSTLSYPPRRWPRSKAWTRMAR